MNRYVLITPAKNEADFIENTLKSVINQTILPVKWVIVNDGSTDNTADIVKPYLNNNNFISLLNLENKKGRDFSSKAYAFDAGYKLLNGSEYDFIGNLDADIGLEPDYYEKVIERFLRDEKIGIAGGVRQDFIDNKFIKIKSSRNSVAGGLQLFRKKCFEDIGGYKPLKYGGIDAFAETMARMLNWKVVSFEDIIARHYRPTGSASNRNALKQAYVSGIKHYLLGYHPLFFLFRFALRLKQKPYIIGSLITIWGYLFAFFIRMKRPVSKKFIEYLRKEQIARLKRFIVK